MKTFSRQRNFGSLVFDMPRFAVHPPVVLEIHSLGGHAPTKQFEDDNSVVAALRSMANPWGGRPELTASTKRI
jgi:hypothetical protein